MSYVTISCHLHTTQIKSFQTRAQKRRVKITHAHKRPLRDAERPLVGPAQVGGRGGLNGAKRADRAVCASERLKTEQGSLSIS